MDGVFSVLSGVLIYNSDKQRVGILVNEIIKPFVNSNKCVQSRVRWVRFNIGSNNFFLNMYIFVFFF